LDALIQATEGFSGSEIEQAIVSAMYAARAQNAEVSENDLLNEIKQTKPLSVVMAEKIDEVRDWAVKRTVPCD
jgi:ATP-dependent 26S proteasome regulatory subunit